MNTGGNNWVVPSRRNSRKSSYGILSGVDKQEASRRFLCTCTIVPIWDRDNGV